VLAGLRGEDSVAELCRREAARSLGNAIRGGADISGGDTDPSVDAVETARSFQAGILQSP